MATEIYYFSGTGNTLHIAKELQKQLPGSVLVPIVHALKGGTIKTDADTVGIVFPIYATTFPDIIGQFLERLTWDAAPYIFAVSSRNCMNHVFSQMDEILAKKGGVLSASLSVQMPQNYLPVFKMAAQADIERMDAALDAKLDKLTAAVLEQRVQMQEAKKLPFIFAALYSLVRFFSFLNRKTNYFNMANRFYATDVCTSCGLCEKVCLSQRIGFESGKPEWDANKPCQLCLACIHYCPAQAIQLKRTGTAKKGRYHHPGITPDDIAAQI